MYQKKRIKKARPFAQSRFERVGSLKNRKHHTKSGRQRMYRNIRPPPFANGCNETA